MLNLTLALLGSVVPLQQSTPRVEKVDELGMTLTLPAQVTELEDDSGVESDEDDLLELVGKLGAKDFSIAVMRTDDTLDDEPSDITWRMHDWVNDEDYEGPEFRFDGHRLVSGPFGYVPYASLLHGSISEQGATNATGYAWYLAGLSGTSGYCVYVWVEPNPSEAEKKIVLDFLTTGVVCTSATREAKWKDEDAQSRWLEGVPDAASKKSLKLEKLIRTEHYLVLTNSSGGAAFAKQMELNYATIRKIFPFDEVPGRKLMPVFLFQTPDQYYDFYARRFETTLEEARDSKGVASGDFYATYYEAPQDPVHIHEATHQIFANRLALDGAGSWYQEGVAEYVETKPNERNDVARRVKDGKHTPLRELMRLESLLGSSEDDVSGESAAGNNYKQAALLIEFLRDSKFGKDKFVEWLRAMGNVPDNDLAKIEAVFKRVYGVTIDELDAKLQEYCKKR